MWLFLQRMRQRLSQAAFMRGASFALRMLVVLALIIGGCGSEKRQMVVLYIQTSGGAGYAGDVTVSGAPAKEFEPTHEDAAVRLKSSVDPSITGTITRLNDRGEVFVSVSVGRKIVFRGTADDTNRSVNIVV
jgi:hypothetical protein